MSNETAADRTDHYEMLQISPNADPETIHRVFRLLAQRFHPDNAETGNEERFRQIHEAYLVLSDPERRAQYDIRHETVRQERWRFAATGAPTDNDFDTEQHTRALVLEVLYTKRRTDPAHPGVSNLELAQLLGMAREHLEFTCWYLTQRKLVTRSDQSSFLITAEGVDYLEERSQSPERRLRLKE
jgi:curved DNA-binding protein CbpA